ncbi:MAG: ion channel [Bacteroidota bacterium]|nr:ion channel [Bacteroidota bacterium]
MKTFRKKIQRDDTGDLGFGSRLSQQQPKRLLNRDGTFNVNREGMSIIRSNSLYHWLLTISWAKFHFALIISFLVINTLFAEGYYMLGNNALNGAESTTMPHQFWNCFFFSVETFATIGYGALNPRSFGANWLMTAESFFGLFCVAMATGLLFARFSRPNAKILYSNNALIVPFKEGRAFMFRMMNIRSSQLIHVEAEVIFSRMEEDKGKRIRRYHKLQLERDKVMFFPLHWTVVHPISEESPLYKLTKKDFENSEVEFMILVNAVDETYAQSVYSRSSYRHEEIVWGAKFRSMFHEENGTITGVRLEHIHHYEHAPLD